MAKLWPSYSCTVVLARRVVISGRIALPATPAAVKPTPFARQFRHFRRHLQVDAPAGQHGRREAQADAEFLLFQRDLVVVLGHRDEDLAAGQERAFLAADRHHVRLGQDAHQAILLLRLERRAGCRSTCAASTGRRRVPVRKFDSKVVAQLPERVLQVAPASSLSSRVFDTSAIFTSSITCCGALTLSMLTTRTPPAGAAAGARRRRRPARAGSVLPTA